MPRINITHQTMKLNPPKGANLPQPITRGLGLTAKNNKERARQIAGALDNIEFHTRYHFPGAIGVDIIRKSLADAYALLKEIDG